MSHNHITLKLPITKAKLVGLSNFLPAIDHLLQIDLLHEYLNCLYEFVLPSAILTMLIIVNMLLSGLVFVIVLFPNA